MLRETERAKMRSINVRLVLPLETRDELTCSLRSVSNLVIVLFRSLACSLPLLSSSNCFISFFPLLVTRHIYVAIYFDIIDLVSLVPPPGLVVRH